MKRKLWKIIMNEEQRTKEEGENRKKWMQLEMLI